MNRNWREFWTYAFKSLKYTAISILLVPIYFVLINPNFSAPDYSSHLWFSSRIGIQIATFFWLCSTAIYVGVYYYDPSLILTLKKSIRFQVIKGFAIMVLALALTSFAEPYISGRTFGVQGISIGLLIGGVTFLLTIFYVAYKQTHEHNLKLRAESAETNLNVLKNQMQPHFLFNSLNSLAELMESNKDDASAMTQKLADLYREILENSKQPLSTVQSEISIINKYLELEKLRFGERLSYSIIEPADSGTAYIPSLVLQTLVENAIKHGIAQSENGGQVDVIVTKHGSGYRVAIGNSGSALKEIKYKGTGIQNTIARLDLLYGNKHQFQLSGDDQTTSVSFWFSGISSGI